MPPVVPVDGRLWPLLTQLDTGAVTDDDDCQVLTGLNGIKWASRGKIGPRTQEEVKEWVEQFRRWAHCPRGGLLTYGHTYRAYHHPELQRMLRAAGYGPLGAAYYRELPFATSSGSSVKGKLKNDFYVHLLVDYGVLNAGNAPSGDPNFRDDHALGLLGARTVKGYVWTNDGDPLFDGRRHDIPKDWQATHLRYFMAAAGAYAPRPLEPGYGYATCIVFDRPREL